MFSNLMAHIHAIWWHLVVLGVMLAAEGTQDPCFPTHLADVAACREEQVEKFEEDVMELQRQELLQVGVSRVQPPRHHGRLPSFSEYLSLFGHTYENAELAMREKLYARRLQLIEKQNAKGGLWVAGVNHLAANTAEEDQALFGYDRSWRQAHHALIERSSLPADAPTSLDWRDARPIVVSPVKNQGNCGSCWAFAATEVLESHIALATGMLFDLSPQEMLSCTPNPRLCGGTGGCNGAIAQLAFNYSAEAGLSTIWKYPYLSGITGKTGGCYGDNQTKIAGVTGYAQLPSNDGEALLAAALKGPVALSVAASGWTFYESGVWDGCNKAHPIINHQVVLMGFGHENLTVGVVPYWLIRNSWGVTWGEKGYMRLRRYPEGEPCGLDTEPLQGYSCFFPNNPQNVTVCGECGLLSDSSYPVGSHLGAPEAVQDPVAQG